MLLTVGFVLILQVTLLVGDVSFLHDTNGLTLLKERYHKL